VGTVSSADPDASVELNVPEPSQYYLIWITSLADVDGGFRVEIEDVALNAR
jgi:hypothetical protein